MLKDKIISFLDEYLDAPEAWSDNPMLEIDPADPSHLRLCDENDGVDPENSTLDYWDVMDLLRMSVSNPGQWEIDPEAVDDMAGSYT